MLCRFLGVSADAELEEIKSAYRRLSKLYHPDTTQLPLEIAAQKFMRLKVSLPFQTLMLDMILLNSLLSNFAILDLTFTSTSGEGMIGVPCAGCV